MLRLWSLSFISVFHLPIVCTDHDSHNTSSRTFRTRSDSRLELNEICIAWWEGRSRDWEQIHSGPISTALAHKVEYCWFKAALLNVFVIMPLLFPQISYLGNSALKSYGEYIVKPCWQWSKVWFSVHSRTFKGSGSKFENFQAPHKTWLLRSLGLSQGFGPMVIQTNPYILYVYTVHIRSL